MSLCAQCGAEVYNSPLANLCAYHATDDAAWSASNRLACDMLHRGVTPPRPPDEPPTLWIDGWIAG